MSSFKNTKHSEPKTDNRADWEHSFFQKKQKNGKDINNEPLIKSQLKPENCFDPKLIDSYINPQLSSEEQIEQKYIKTGKIDKKEKIILENYERKKNGLIQKDKENLDKLGLRAVPETNYGKTKLILMHLKNCLNKRDVDKICNIYLRLKEDTFNITPDLQNEFSKEIKKMKEIVSEQDLIEMQFTKFYNQMPPLNISGFRKLDKWQIDVINNIQNNISTIVSAPTSAGKTILSGYTTIKGNTLIILPTDALVWQMASYVGGIIDEDVPILTETHQTIPRRDEMVEKLNNSRVIVGTPEIVLNYLPLIKTKFDWIIFDEIHMIGNLEGSGMEIIAKMYPDVPFLALSATINNIEQITTWFKNINPERRVENINYTKRFFNLQKYYYNSSNINYDKAYCLDNNFVGELNMINPLALIKIEQIQNGEILQKTLQPTPQDAWVLYKKLIEQYGDLGELNHNTFFNQEERIELSKAMDYFNLLVKFMVTNYNEVFIKNILTSFQNNHLENDTNNSLARMALLLKKENKTPAIIFQKNTNNCLDLIRQFAKDTDKMENDKYPKLLTMRIRHNKKVERNSKDEDEIQHKSTKENKNVLKQHKISITETKNTKKELKEMKTQAEHEDEDMDLEELQKPTDEFNFNDQQLFTEGLIDEWSEMLKPYHFNKTGSEYHFIIKLLWRGVGIYAKGLPDPYLRLVQTLACQKKLAIVFSDMSLVFGVSMPFRTVVIHKNATAINDIDTLTYHQMSGRAGRRGLDKEGNIIFFGYKWNEIEHLSIAPLPDIKGVNTLNYVSHQANKISRICENELNWDNIFNNSLSNSIDGITEGDNDNKELLEQIKSNYSEGSGWDFASCNDKNYLHMMWKLRNSEREPLVIAYIIPYIKKAFAGMDPVNEKNQILLVHFLSYFINVKETDKDEYILPECAIFKDSTFAKLFGKLEELELIEPTSKIDGRVFDCFEQNKLILNSNNECVRNELIIFGNKIQAIQHFLHHSKLNSLSKLFGKVLTRIWWIYHLSSPIMKPYYSYDIEV